MKMDPVAEKAAGGDKDALAEIVRLHYSDVFRFCARQLNARLAEDAAQETLIHACRTIRNFRGESSVKTWLFGIALNVCRNERRKMRDTLPLQDWDRAENGHAERTIDTQILKEALAQLDEGHRTAVILHEMEGLTYDECAAIMKIPTGTVKSRLHHAFAKLRTILSEKVIAI